MGKEGNGKRKKWENNEMGKQKMSWEKNELGKNIDTTG